MLISDAYREQQIIAHQDANYGHASVIFAPQVSQLCNTLQVTSVLDYGAGKCRLFEHLQVGHRMQLQAYDPAISSLAERPSPSQLVVCLDVLEHIEPDCLDAVLDDLQSLTLEFGFFTVATVPALRVLDDGRNAHLIVEDAAWWLPKIMQRWTLQSFQKLQNNFLVIVTRIDDGNHDARGTDHSNRELDATRRPGDPRSRIYCPG